MKTNWKEMVVVITIILMVTIATICNFIAAYNSFDNSREYYIVEKVDEIQLQLNNIEEHQRYIEIQLEENLVELD
jgi:hypothetical protein